jgi:ABC-2 type transport system permease protein
VAKRGFRRWSTYRGATFAGVFTNTVFGVIQAYVLLAVFHQRPHINGFDATDAVTFTFVAQGFLMIVAVFPWSEIALRVRTGDVVTDLYRPIDFQGYWLAQDVGRASFHALFRGIPPFLVGALLFQLRLTTSPIDWAAFLVATLLAIVASFGVRFMINLAAFWLLDIRGPQQLLMTVWIFLSGFIVPITLFPHWLEVIARASPFAAMVQLPIEIVLGKHHGLDLLGVLALQVFWAVVLIGAGRRVQAAAMHKLVVQGG